MDKKCNKCSALLPIGDFNKGRNVCKSCLRDYYKANREKKLAYQREHYQKNKERICEYNHEYGQKNKEQIAESKRAYRTTFPNKATAHAMVNNAIKRNTLIKQPCEICGSIEHVNAHHDDYLKPLSVRWLCMSHHRAWHSEHGEAKNGRC